MHMPRNQQSLRALLVSINTRVYHLCNNAALSMGDALIGSLLALDTGYITRLICGR